MIGFRLIFFFSSIGYTEPSRSFETNMHNVEQIYKEKPTLNLSFMNVSHRSILIYIYNLNISL